MSGYRKHQFPGKGKKNGVSQSHCSSLQNSKSCLIKINTPCKQQFVCECVWASKSRWFNPKITLQMYCDELPNPFIQQTEMCCLLFLCINDAAALITRVNSAIVCLRLSLPAPVCRPLPHAKRTMKSILFCEWHRWMIDRYPSLSVTHTARGAFFPRLHIYRGTQEHIHAGAHVRAQIRYHGKLLLASLSTHTQRK